MKNNVKGKLASFIMILSMFAILLPVTDSDMVQADNKTISVGDKVYFGRYYQDLVISQNELEALKQYEFVDNELHLDNVSYLYEDGNYYKESAIEWRVLDEDSESYLLLSEKIISRRRYHDWSCEGWKDASLRVWLNSNFINYAFAKEKDDLIETEVVSRNVNREKINLAGSTDDYVLESTRDKVWLLDEDEARNIEYGFDSDKSRIAYATQYVDMQESAQTWCLRGHPYYFYGQACCTTVEKGGKIHEPFGVRDTNIYPTYDKGIRPVIRVKKDSENISLEKPVPGSVGSNNSNYNTSTESILGYPDLTTLLDEWRKSLMIDKFMEFCHTLEGYENESYVIPGIRQTNESDGSNVCRTMVPQGCCTTGKYFLISAYCAAAAQDEKKPAEGVMKRDEHKTHNSVIYVMDKNSRKYKCTLVLNNNKSHVGALSYSSNNGIIYIADSSSKRCVWKLPEKEINTAVKSGDDAYRITLKDKFSIGSEIAKPSFLCCYGNKVFVGVCVESAGKDGKDKNKSYMVAYSAKDGKLDRETKIVLPLKTQGVAFREHNGETYLIASCSLGRKNISNIRVYKLSGSHFGNFINNEVNTIKYPNMSEDIELKGNKLNICFESAAAIYREGLDKKGHSQNIIDRIPTASFYKIIYKENIFNAYSLDDEGKEVIDSGKCGDNLEYVLYENGCMDISGQGNMYDFEYDTQPWSEYKDKIISVSIDADVCNIGEYAFIGCGNLKKVSLSEATPESDLFSIGAYSFAECSGITDVLLPESEYFIDDTAFTGCGDGLTINSDCEYVRNYCSDKDIPLHTHKYVFDEKIAATCGCAGYDKYVCECGKVDVRNVVDSNAGHKFELVTDIASTYDEMGIKGYQCTECGTYYEEETDVLTKAEEDNNVATDNPQNKGNNTQKAVTVTDKKVKKPGKVVRLVLFTNGKKLEATWRGKLNISGYQLQYAQNRKFTKKKKTVTVGKNKLHKIIKKVKKGKTYYVRVRAYRKASGKKVYGKWSKVKKIKIRTKK